MLINELPDDCLLAIFDYIQDIKDLINLFKVFEKWSDIIADRAKKLKYLIDQPTYSPGYVYLHLKEPIDVTCLSKLFPNLRIAEFSYPFNRRAPIEDMVQLIRDSESLKGIICHWDYYLNFELIPENENFEMFSAGYIDPNISGVYENVKQLHLLNSNLGLFECAAHCFPNLERLKIYATDGTEEQSSEAPVLANLKILEMCLPVDHWNYIWCSFMDACPALQSAYFKIESRRYRFTDWIKHASLQDLVIQFDHLYEPFEWDRLRGLISKYPNLKHLALRNTYLKEEHIKQLILILPKLTLLDIRKSYGFPREVARHVGEFCKRYGRSIKFYIGSCDEQIESDWPQILNRPDKICRGFDFMEHCFFKSFDNLPYFLDPMDD
ncbi:uncharacterized protein LOC107360807 isoform X2 [Tetranychus urticae]|uniref:uncharacterized protein LOC107360807 isoform X2 n=1 Tax=Tetranychus urticae TaxID=32264 RepID=UPI00077BC204|nr:uncharacterized protein LOC107360807 isoform X2 [Tetranychus urticae]